MVSQLSGYKEVAAHIERVWGVPVSIHMIWRYGCDEPDPLPLITIRRPGKKRGRVVADPGEVEAWARRRIAPYAGRM